MATAKSSTITEVPQEAGESQVVALEPLQIAKIVVRVKGTSRLVCHRFSTKAILSILNDHMGKAKTGSKEGREPKNPPELFMASLYPIDGVKPVMHGKFDLKDAERCLTAEDISGLGVSISDVFAVGRFGFPSIGIKLAMIRAGKECKMVMTDLKQQFVIPGEFVEIECDPGPNMRLDMVRLADGKADVRFRGEFVNWSMNIPIHFNAKSLSLPHVFNLLRQAGFGVGIGEGRPFGKASTGTWGTFELVENGSD